MGAQVGNANRIHGRSRGRRQGRRRSKRAEPCYAAIDLGTNSCRMLIARPCDNGFAVIDGFSRIVRLGKGLTASGSLQDDAMDRTIAALKVCAEKIERRGVNRVRGVATAACRQAANGCSFLDKVTAETGITLEAIDAGAEARLTMAGCSPLMRSGHPHAILFDIGGGSTEIMWIDTSGTDTPRIRDMISLPLGVVTLTEEFGLPEEAAAPFDAITQRIERDLIPFDTANQISDVVAGGSVQMLGTSGTMTTLGAVHLGLNRYDRSRVDGLNLDLANIRAHAARLSELDCQAREQLPCIGPGRADLMLMGCIILGAILKRWPVPAVRVADRGIREGLIMDMIAAEKGQRTDALAAGR